MLKQVAIVVVAVVVTIVVAAVVVMADAMRSRPMVARPTAVKRMVARCTAALRAAFTLIRMLPRVPPFKVALQSTPTLFPPNQSPLSKSFHDEVRFVFIRRFAQTPSNFGRGLFFAPN
jgi:hypothetical protein